METIFERLGINESRYRLERVESDNESFHPGRSAYIKVQNEVVGVVGQVHPLMEKKYDVKDVYVVELNLSALLNIKTGKVKYQPIPQRKTSSMEIFPDGASSNTLEQDERTVKRQTAEMYIILFHILPSFFRS